MRPSSRRGAPALSCKFNEFTPGRGYTEEDWDEVGDPHEPTEEQWAQAKSFAEMLPDVAVSIERAGPNQSLRSGVSRDGAPKAR